MEIDGFICQYKSSGLGNIFTMEANGVQRIISTKA